MSDEMRCDVSSLVSCALCTRVSWFMMAYLLNHFLHLQVGHILSQVLHHKLELLGGDESVAIFVEHFECLF